jgi:hypothetical protein
MTILKMNITEVEQKIKAKSIINQDSQKIFYKDSQKIISKDSEKIINKDSDKRPFEADER